MTVIGVVGARMDIQDMVLYCTQAGSMRLPVSIPRATTMTRVYTSLYSIRSQYSVLYDYSILSIICHYISRVQLPKFTPYLHSQVDHLGKTQVL